MAENTVPTNPNEDKAYRTKFGYLTPEKAAVELLDSAASRLIFLAAVLGGVPYGEKFTIPEYGSQGLARIVEDIVHDVNEAAYYHNGVYDQPGKIGG